MEHHADLLTSGRWRLRTLGWRDAVALLLVLALIVVLGSGARQMALPLGAARPEAISLSPLALPGYTLRTVLRMLAALGASFVFTFAYASLAAKSRAAEAVLIPLLDVLQSVPILGYLSFTVVFFLSIAPGSTFGAELAAIFAIFTSQAWNMAFSFYQSLRTVPRDLDEASRSLRHTGWQRFWRLEVPFAMPGLVWNAMMSMSGGWFFVVASEAISVGDLRIALPGVGAYVARAIAERNLAAIGFAIAAMTIAIVLYDQLLFRPMVAWAHKFRCDQTVSGPAPRSWLLDLLHRASLPQRVGAPLGAMLHRAARARLSLGVRLSARERSMSRRAGRVVWFSLCAAGALYAGAALLRIAAPALSWSDVADVARNGALTLARVLVLIGIATAVWVPVGVLIGLRPRATALVQPVAQFLAAFPANLLFPLAVFAIVRFGLAPAIWLSALMILGTQWYILFNVIAGASAFPDDLKEAAASLRVRTPTWWREIVLPGILPYYVTGAITASGGAWNASIVSELVGWGPTTLDASGLGAYVARTTAAGDYPRIALGVAAMSLLVIAMNRLMWRPLYAFAERRSRLD
ncbi:ABC transporter permease [Burkholderia thailandensis]|uniref:Binding-protein-dependent transport system inner membrane component family protein n=1 Tax=Burkholderia thailandensis TaxID=57975 RepID=A0AAW9CW15_BURTH|nr:ABC transporter permease subunit [Burkholderia thailandensis]AIP63955.1 sulfonate ABC transporter permease [Burkholderia thailandensis]AOI52862.1 sulfonate ABC transporter permease [Burkholderia thailandensis]MCS3393867.1 ABC transporter permease subunit [Burkholderia thailandensis]MCS6428276.1 ABC transporter permease subunit [Burkholderia thailandensis]MCS6456190.1 ABC transporter permease subunit [Burkholderia thailandensis]